MTSEKEGWHTSSTIKKDMFASHVTRSFVLQMVFIGFFWGGGVATALLGPRMPHCWSFDIAHRRATHGGTSLEVGSAFRRDLYLTAYNANFINLF